MRLSVVSVVVTLAVLAGSCALGAPKGLSIVPWDLYQEALRWQVMAPGVTPPERSYLLWCGTDLSDEQLLRLAAAGYTIKAVLGSIVVVSAPITRYIDPEFGVDSLGFVSMMLPDVPLLTNVYPHGDLTALPWGEAPSWCLRCPICPPAECAVPY